MDTINYDEVSAPTDEQLKLITALAQEQLRLEKELKQAEEHVANVSRRLFKVQQVDLPDAMAAAGCRAFTLTSGQSIKVEDGISATLTEPRRQAACDWLKENGFGDIVKEQLALEFDRGQEAQVQQVVEYLVGIGYVPAVKTTVNTGTLKALIREQLEAGREIPLDLLGAHQWKKAKIA